jgi:hypothetical protein
MSISEKAKGFAGGMVAQRVGGDRPGAVRAAAGAAVAGAITTVLVFRLLRGAGDD